MNNGFFLLESLCALLIISMIIGVCTMHESFIYTCYSRIKNIEKMSNVMHDHCNNQDKKRVMVHIISGYEKWNHPVYIETCTISAQDSDDIGNSFSIITGVYDAA